MGVFSAVGTVVGLPYPSMSFHCIEHLKYGGYFSLSHRRVGGSAAAWELLISLTVACIFIAIELWG